MGDQLPPREEILDSDFGNSKEVVRILLQKRSGSKKVVEVGKVIGHGEHGRVFVCGSGDYQGNVAVKIIRITTDKERENAEKEARILKLLDSGSNCGKGSGVVKFLDYFVALEHKAMLLVMEYVRLLFIV
jgi:serine/threonine protein kinase